MINYKMKMWVVVPAVLASMPLCTAAMGSVVASDDFDVLTDVNSKWTQVIDNPSQLTVIRQNQRVEAISTGSTSANNDALFLSNGPGGFRLSTADDFEIAIDFSFTHAALAGGASIQDATLLDFGVGRDLDGQDSAAIGFGYINGGIPIAGVAFASRINDSQSLSYGVNGSTSGTFVISYNAAGDDLTASIQGGPSFVLNDTVQSIWGASDLLVSFGARGNGMVFGSGDATLDNFVVRSGTLVPEPATMGLLGIAAMGLLKRKR